jgi:hypothetical protein
MMWRKRSTTSSRRPGKRNTASPRSSPKKGSHLKVRAKRSPREKRRRSPLKKLSLRRRKNSPRSRLKPKRLPNEIE